MKYKTSKTRLDLLKNMAYRNKNIASPYGDFCYDTVGALELSLMTEKTMEELLKEDVELFFSHLSQGCMCEEAEIQMRIFIRRFNRYCLQFGL